MLLSDTSTKFRSAASLPSLVNSSSSLSSSSSSSYISEEDPLGARRPKVSLEVPRENHQLNWEEEEEEALRQQRLRHSVSDPSFSLITEPFAAPAAAAPNWQSWLGLNKNNLKTPPRSYHHPGSYDDTASSANLASPDVDDNNSNNGHQPTSSSAATGGAATAGRSVPDGKGRQQQKSKQQHRVDLGSAGPGGDSSGDDDQHEEEEEEVEEEEEDEVSDEVARMEMRRRRKNRAGKGAFASHPADRLLGQHPQQQATSAASAKAKAAAAAAAAAASAKAAQAAFEVWKSSQQEGREMICETFPIDVDTLFTLLFTKSKFYIDFHNSRKTFDIVQSSWQDKVNTNDKTREVSFTLSLTHPMGPKHSQVTETQTLQSDQTSPGEIYVVQIDTVNAGIPYADSFGVALNFCVSKVSQFESRLAVYAAIKYKKTVWGIVKTFIEKNTWTGLEDFYTHLARYLLAECEEMSARMSNGVRGGDLDGRVSAKGAKDGSKQSSSRAKADPSQPSQSRQNSGVDQLSSAAAAGGASGGAVSTASALLRSASSRLAAASSTSETLFKVILVFLIALLCANSMLFCQMWFLESRIAKDVSKPMTDEQLRFLDPDLVSSSSSSGQDHKAATAEQNKKRTTEQWLLLLQKQEMIHQMELEKWHEMLGMATELLRKTEQSLSNLQRSIHPLTLQKLRGILYLQQQQQEEEDERLSSSSSSANAKEAAMESLKPVSEKSSAETKQEL